MWRLWVCVGSLVWLATICASAAINYFAGHSFGRTAQEAQIFSTLGVAADAWKAIGPIFILSLWRKSFVLASNFATLVWLACFGFAVASALGLAAQNRMAVTGGREIVALSYQSRSQELQELEARQKLIPETRSPNELEKFIDAVFAKVIAGRGTVDSISEHCRKDTPRTRDACAEIATLRQALAQALEAQRLERRVDDVRQQVGMLRDRGGTLESDPQAQLISRLSFGRLAVNDIGLGLILLLVIMVELISAFAPIVLHDYANAMRSSSPDWRRDRTRQGRGDRDDATVLEAIPNVMEYLADNLVPDPKGQVSLHHLLIDFAEWCDRHRLHTPSLRTFIDELNAVCDRELKGKIRRDGVTYFGFRLESSRVLLPAPGG